MLLTSLMKKGRKHSNFRRDSYKPAPALSRFRRLRWPEIEPCCSRACTPTSRWNYHGERSDLHCFFVDKNIAVNAHGILKEYACRWRFLYFYARRGRFAWSFTMEASTIGGSIQGGKTFCASFCASLIAGSRRAFLCVDLVRPSVFVCC